MKLSAVNSHPLYVTFHTNISSSDYCN